MHIAFFNRSYYPETTATGQLLTELCEDLVGDHGCRVSVVAGPVLTATPEAARRRGGLVSRESHNGVEIHRVRGTRFDKRRFAGRAANYVSYFGSAVWAGLRLEKPDVVVALTDPPIVGLAAWLAGKRAGAPLVMAFKDLFPEVAALLPDVHSGAINRVLDAVNRFLIRRAAVNLTLGETMRQRLIAGKGAPPDRTEVIPDWVDTAAIVPGPRRNAFAEAHGLADAFVVMHAGNLGLAQNLDTLIDAAARLRDLPDLRVVLVGEGVRKAELLARARGLGNVLFLPFEPRERMAESLAAADLFVVALNRGLAGAIVPSKVYTILAAGRPYVAAVDAGSEAAAIAAAHQCGVPAEPGDVEALVAGILTYYRDRDRARRDGANARTAALVFDRRVQVARYMNVFRRCHEARI